MSKRNRILFYIVSCVFAMTQISTAATKIMPFGDSITRGFLGNDVAVGSYRQYLEDQLTALGVDFDFVGNYSLSLGDMQDVEYQAVGGYTIDRMLQEFGVAIERHQPDILLMLAGTNDIWGRLSEADFVDRYERLVSLAREHSADSRIVFATVPPIGCCVAEKEFWITDWAANLNETKVSSMNAAIREVADRHQFVTVADYNEAFDVTVDLTDDMVHPNGAGQRKLGREYLRELGSAPFGLLRADNIDHLASLIGRVEDSAQGDLNSDGQVDLSDHDFLIREVIGSPFGDSNLDGRFDSADLLQVFKVGEYEDHKPLNSGWAEGDWDGDGDFATSDLIRAYQFGITNARLPAVVPEPRFGNAFLFSGVAVCVFRRRIPC